MFIFSFDKCKSHLELKKVKIIYSLVFAVGVVIFLFLIIGFLELYLILSILYSIPLIYFTIWAGFKLGLRKGIFILLVALVFGGALFVWLFVVNYKFKTIQEKTGQRR
jgi:hypothetical protein